MASKKETQKIRAALKKAVVAGFDALIAPQEESLAAKENASILPGELKITVSGSNGVRMDACIRKCRNAAGVAGYHPCEECVGRG